MTLDIKQLDKEKVKELYSQGKITDEQLDDYITFRYAKKADPLDIPPDVALKAAQKGYLSDDMYHENKLYHANPYLYQVRRVVGATIDGVWDGIEEASKTFNALFGTEIDVASTREKWEHMDGSTGEGTNAVAEASTTGKVISDISQFTVGFLPAFKSLKYVGMGAGMAGFTAGAVGDGVTSDPYEERLSNLMQHSSLANPIAEYLKADPSDSILEAKGKNMIEGGLVGIAAEGLIKAFTYSLREAKQRIWTESMDDPEKVAEKVEEIAKGSVKQEVEQETLKVDLPNTEQPKQTTPEIDIPKEKVKQLAETALNGGSKESSEVGIDFNFDKLDTTDKVAAFINENSKVLREEIDSAMGGATKSLKETEAQANEMADLFGLDVDELKNTFKATQDLDSKVTLYKGYMLSYAKHLDEEAERLSKKIDAGEATDAELLEFYDKTKFYGSLQAMTKAIITGSARATSAGRIIVRDSDYDPTKIAQAKQKAKEVDAAILGDTSEKPTSNIFIKDGDNMVDVMDAGGEGAIENIISKSGGRHNLKALPKKWLEGKELKAKNRMAKHLYSTKTIDGIAEFYQANLLSSTGTYVANVVGNSLAMGADFLEDTLAITGEALSKRDLQYLSLIKAKVVGNAVGLIDALHYNHGKAWKALATAEPQLDAGHTFRDVEENKLKGVIGETIRLPFRLLTAQDEVFKNMAYKSELYTAVTEAAIKHGKVGDKEWIRKYVKQASEAPSSKLHHRALEKARELTFQEDFVNENQIDSILRAGQTLTRNPFVKFFIPFYKTPVNILKFVGRRTPVVNLLSSKVKEELKAGGMARNKALARMATGTSLLGLGYTLYESGDVVGAVPKDKMESYQNARVLPYSIRIGDEFYQFNRLDPLGMFLGLGADVARVVNTAEVKDEEIEDILSQGLLVVSDNLLSKTYMKGLSDMMHVLVEPDRYPPKKFLNNIAANMLPFSAGLRQAQEARDDFYREKQTLIDHLYERLDRLSLVPKLDILGNKVELNDKIATAYQHTKFTRNPIFREMFRVGANVRDIRYKTKFSLWGGNGTEVEYELTPQEKNEIKLILKNELGVEQVLTDLINSEGYKSIKDMQTQAALIENTYSRLRNTAKTLWATRNEDKIMTEGQKKLQHLIGSLQGTDTSRNDELTKPNPFMEKVLKEAD